MLVNVFALAIREFTEDKIFCGLKTAILHFQLEFISESNLKIVNFR